MKYIKISRYEPIKKSQPLSVGKTIEWEKSHLLGYYIQPVNQIANAIDGEFDCDNEVGTKIILEVIEMEEDKYNELPDFAGY